MDTRFICGKVNFLIYNTINFFKKKACVKMTDFPTD
jgi:hypothetical protein